MHEFLVIGGVLSVMLALACILQFVVTRSASTEPNRLIGIKTKQTLASDEAWRRGHEAAQPALLTGGVVGLAGISAVFALRPLLPEVDDLAWGVVAGLNAGLVLGLLVFATIKANRAASQVH